MAMIDLTERCVRYMMKIECRYCGSEVYPHEDDARELVCEWIKHDDLRDIDGLKQRVERTCDGCEHMLDKDD